MSFDEIVLTNKELTYLKALDKGDRYDILDKEKEKEYANLCELKFVASSRERIKAEPGHSDIVFMAAITE